MKFLNGLSNRLFIELSITNGTNRTHITLTVIPAKAAILPFYDGFLVSYLRSIDNSYVLLLISPYKIYYDVNLQHSTNLALGVGGSNGFSINRWSDSMDRNIPSWAGLWETMLATVNYVFPPMKLH